MVRETRHLWVGNLPDNIREERILEHFKRHGKVQSVKILAKKEEEDGNGISATVAFIDIKSAAKAHNAENKIEERTLKTDYYEPPASSTASSAIFIHERDDTLGRPAGTPYSAARSARYALGLQEERSYERTGYYYDRTGDRDTYMRRPMGLGYHDDDNYPVRGRSRDRYIRSATTGNVYQDGTESRNQNHFRGHNNRQHFDQQRYTSAEQYSEDRESSSSGGRTTRRPSVTASTVASTVSSPTHNNANSTTNNRQRRPKGRSPAQSRSGSRSNNSQSRSSSRSSNGSRSSSASSKLRSSSSNESSRSRSPSKSRSPAASHGSQSSGKSGRADRPASAITAPSVGSFLPSAVTTPTLNNCTVSSQAANLLTSLLPLIDSNCDKDDKRPLGICVRNLPVRSTDTSLKDGLFHEYKKHGKVTMVKVIGQGTDRYAVVCFKKPEDVEKALEVSKDKLFFGCKIEVTAHEGLDGEDNEFRPLEADLDEYHPKATRTLFIGNLEKDITTTELKKNFEQFGEIIEIDIKKQGSASSYAFIQYSDIASVVKAMRKLDGENLGTNRIKLGFGKSMPTNCVWLDGIVDTFPEKLLTRHFNRFGPVNYTVIDRERGHALIFYDTTEFAQIAVSEMRGRMLVGKRLQVDYASRECQQAFFEKMEMTGQMLPGDRPWERRERREFEVVRDERFTREARPGFENRTYPRYENQTRTARANFRGVQRGTFPTRGRGQTFPGRYDLYHDEFVERRLRNYDEEFSQGSGASFEDSYEQELREYGFSQRERREYSSEERGVRGKSFSPLRRRDTNSASPPPRERLKDERSNSPHFRNDRTAVRNEKHPEHYIGKDRFPIVREDGVEEVSYEERDRCKVSETTERPSRKKLKHQFNVSDHESQHSQSPTRSRHHSQSLSPLSKERKSSKDQERLNFHLKSPSSHNSSLVNSPSHENSFDDGNPCNTAVNASEQLTEAGNKSDPKEFAPDDVSAANFRLDVTGDHLETSKRKTLDSRSIEDFLSSPSEIADHLERKRKLLDSDGHYINNVMEDSSHVKSDDPCLPNVTNSKIKMDASWLDVLDKTNVTQDNKPDTEPCEMPKKEVPPTDFKYLQDKQYHLIHLKLLEQLGDGVQDNSTEQDKPCKKKPKISELDSALDVCEINAKEIATSILKENAKESHLYHFLHPSRSAGYISLGGETNSLLPKLQETHQFRKQSDPRRPAELQLSSHYLTQKLKKHGLDSTCTEEDIMDVLNEKQDSTNISQSWRKLGSALSCKDDLLLDVSSGKEGEHGIGDMTHPSDTTLYCRLMKDMPSSLRPDNTTTLLHELKKERDVSPLSLPLPKFAASLRTPKASPNPLASPRPNSVSPKGSTSPKPSMLPLKISVSGSIEVKTVVETPFGGSDLSCDRHTKQNQVAEEKQPVLVSDISSPQMSPKAVPKEESGRSSDSDCAPPLLVNRPSIEERIRALDEKYNAWSGSTRSFSSSLSSDSPTTPTVDYHQKYTIKRRSRYNFLTQEIRTEPSDIMKSLLAKSTIFDQDSKRLEHINEKYEPKEVKVDSPKARPFVRTKAEAKEFSPIQSQVNSIQPFPHNAATVSSTSPPAHNASSSSSIIPSSTQSSQFSGSSRPPVLPPSSSLTPSKTSNLESPSLAPVLQKPNSLQTSLLSVSGVKPLDNGKIQPSLHKDDACPPVLTSIKSPSSSSVYTAISVSLPTLASIPFPHIKKEIMSPTREHHREHLPKKDNSKDCREVNDITAAAKEMPVKKEHHVNHLKEHPNKKEYSSKDSHHRKESSSSHKNSHPVKKEECIPKDMNHIRRDSFPDLKELKGETLPCDTDISGSGVKRRLSSLDSSESDSGKSAKCENPRETSEPSRHMESKEHKSLEPEVKKPKMSRDCGEKERHVERALSPSTLAKKYDKKDKLQKHKHVRSDSYNMEKDEADFSRLFSKGSEQKSKSKIDFLKMKDDKHSSSSSKSKERKDSGKSDSKSKSFSRSSDNRHSDKEGKSVHGSSSSSSSKQKREQSDRDKSKSDKKSGSGKSKKDSSSKKNRSKSDSCKYANFFDDEPVYFSMYDKVKARSSQNQTLKDQAKDLESVRQKFCQLKQSRAKREEKSKSADQDSDRDSDLFSLHSSDSDSKSKSQSKSKHIMKKKKLIIESSSDEAPSRSMSMEDSIRKSFKDNNSSGSLSDSEAELQALISGSRLKTKKPDIYDIDSSDLEEAFPPRYTVRKKLKMKSSSSSDKIRQEKQKPMKSDDSSDNETAFNKFLSKKKEHKKKKVRKDKFPDHKSNSDVSDAEMPKKDSLLKKSSVKPVRKESVKQEVHSPQESKSHHDHHLKTDPHCLESDDMQEKQTSENKDSSSQKQKSCVKKKKKSKKASKSKERKSHKCSESHHPSSKEVTSSKTSVDDERFMDSKEHIKQKSLSPPCLQNSMLSDSEFKTDFSDYDFERSAEPSRITDFWPATKVKNEFDSEPCHYDSSSALSPVKDELIDAGKLNVEALAFADKNLPQFNLVDPLEVGSGPADIPLPNIEPSSPGEGGGLVIDTDRDMCDDFPNMKQSDSEFYGESSAMSKHPDHAKDNPLRKSKKFSKDKWKHGKESNVTMFHKSSPVSDHEHMTANFFDKLISPPDEDSKLSEDMRLDEEIAEEARRLEEELMANTDETTTFGDSESLCKKEEKRQERRFDVEAAEETRRLEEELFSTTQQHWHLKEDKNFCDDTDSSHIGSSIFEKESKNQNCDLDLKGDLYSSLVISSPTEIGDITHRSDEPFLLSEVPDQFKSAPSSYDVDNERKMEDDLAVSALLQEMNNEIPPELPKEPDYLEPLMDENPEDLSYLLAEESSQPLQVDESPREISHCMEDFKSVETSIFSNNMSAAVFDNHSVFELPKETATDVLEDFAFGVSNANVSDIEQNPSGIVQEQEQPQQHGQEQEQQEQQQVKAATILEEQEAVQTETALPLLEPLTSDSVQAECKKSKKKKKKDTTKQLPEKKDEVVPEIEKPTVVKMDEVLATTSCTPNLNVMDEDTVEDTSPPVLQPLSAVEPFTPLTIHDKLQPLSILEGFPSLDLADDIIPPVPLQQKKEIHSLKIDEQQKPHLDFHLSESNLAQFMPQKDLISNSPAADQASDETEIEADYGENNENPESSPNLLQEYPEIANTTSQSAKDITDQYLNIIKDEKKVCLDSKEDSEVPPSDFVSCKEDLPSAEVSVVKEAPQQDSAAELSPNPELSNYSPEHKEPKRKTERTRRGRRPKTRKYSESASSGDHQIPLRTSSRRGRSVATERSNRRSLRSDPYALLTPAENNEVPAVEKVEIDYNDDSDANRDTSSEMNSSKTDTSVVDESENLAKVDSENTGHENIDNHSIAGESNLECHKTEEPKQRRRGRKKKTSEHPPSYMSPPASSHASEKDDGEPTKESHRTKESRLWQSSSQHDKTSEQKPSKNSASVYDVFEFRDSEDEELTFERDIQSSSKDRLLDTCRVASAPHDQKHADISKNVEPLPPPPPVQQAAATSHEKEKKHEEKHKSHEEKETVTKEYVTELSQHGKISITIRLHQRDGTDGSGASTAEVVKTSEAVCEEQKPDHPRVEKASSSKPENSASDNQPAVTGRQTRKSSRLTAQANKTTMDEVIEDVVKGNFKNNDSGAQETFSSRPTRRTRASRRSEEAAARQLEELSSEFTQQDDAKNKTDPIFIIPDNKVKDHHISEPIGKLPMYQSSADNPPLASETEAPKPETRISLRYYRIARTMPRNELSKENVSSGNTIQESGIKSAGEDSSLSSVPLSSPSDNLPCPPLPVMKVEIPKITQSIQNLQKNSKENIERIITGLHKEIDEDSDSRSSPTVLIDPVTGFLTPVNKKGEPKDGNQELLKVTRPGVVVSDTSTADKQSASLVKTIVTTSPTSTTSIGSIKAPAPPSVMQPPPVQLDLNKEKSSTDVPSSSEPAAVPITTAAIVTTTCTVSLPLLTSAATTVISSTTSVSHHQATLIPVTSNNKGHGPLLTSGLSKPALVETIREKKNDVASDFKEKHSTEKNSAAHGVVVTTGHAPQLIAQPPTVTGHTSILTTSTITTTPATLPAVSTSITSSSKLLPSVGQPQVPIAQPVPGQVPSTYHSFTPHVISSGGHIAKAAKTSSITQPVVCHSGVRVMSTLSNAGMSHLHMHHSAQEAISKHGNASEISTVVAATSAIPLYPHPENMLATSKEHGVKVPSSSHHSGHLVLSSSSGIPVIKTESSEMPPNHRPLSKTPPSNRREDRHHVKHEQRISSCMSSKANPHIQVTKHSPTFLTQGGFPLSAYEASVNASGGAGGGVIAELLQNPHLLQQHKDYMAVAAAAASGQFAERVSNQIIRPSTPASGVHPDMTSRLGNPTPPHTPTPPVTSATHLLQSPDLHPAHVAASLLRHQGQTPLLVSPHLGIHASELNAYVHQQMMYVAAHPHYAAMHPEIRAQHEAQVRAAAAMGMTSRFAYPPMAAAATPPSSFRQPVEPRLPHPTAAETKTDLKPSVEPAKVPADRMAEERLHPHKSMKQDNKERKGESKRCEETDLDRHQIAVDGKHVGPGPPMTNTLRLPQGPYPNPVRQLSPHISVSPHERITDSPAVATLYGQGQLRVGVSHHPSRSDDHKMEQLSRPQPLKVDDSDRDMKPPLAHQNPPSTISVYNFDSGGHKVVVTGQDRVSHAGGVLALKKEAISSSHLSPSQAVALSAAALDAHNIPENNPKSMLHSKSFLHHAAAGSLNLGGGSSLSIPSAFSGIGSQTLASSDGRRGSIPTPQTGSEAPVHQPSPARAILQSAGVPRTQPQTPPHASQVPAQGDSLLLQRYPVMWQGLLALKNDQAAVQMHFVSGNPRIAQLSLPVMSDGGTPPVRIAQRMRLEQTQLEGVARKMQLVDEHCILLALPCGRDHMDVLQQSNNLRNGFISYLQLKQAAGIVNAAAPGSQQPAYVIHIFPSCEFSDENMARIAPDLLHSVNDIAHLLIIIATV